MHCEAMYVTLEIIMITSKATVSRLLFFLFASLALIGCSKETVEQPKTTAAVDGCEVDRKIVLAGLDWQSVTFHNEVISYILDKGYNCQTDSIPGSTIPLLTGMIKGNVDITMELWRSNLPAAVAEAEKEGKIIDLGVNFPDAVQGWFVPRYLVEGADALAPGLKKVSDLPKYKKLFSDPESPEKGRFYNCILGWACEVVNTRKLKAYNLEEHYTNFRPGTGAALAAAISSSFERKKPFVAYYWGPTWIFGKYDLVMLEEPAYEKEAFANLAKQDPSLPLKGVAYNVDQVTIGVSTGFAKSAPKVVELLKKYRTTNKLVSEALSYMQDNDASAKEAAVQFLRTRSDLWQKWVSVEVAKRIQDTL